MVLNIYYVLNSEIICNIYVNLEYVNQPNTE